MDENLTPTVDTPKTLSFPDAIRAVIEGKRIARVSWANADYGLLKGDWLMIFHKKEDEQIANFHTWIINDGDLEGTDWIVLPDLS